VRVPTLEVTATYETLPTVVSAESMKKKSGRITDVDPVLLGEEAPPPVSVNVTVVGVNAAVKPISDAALAPVTPDRPVNVSVSPLTAMIAVDIGSSSSPYP
jgi:hypothetical protein